MNFKALFCGIAVAAMFTACSNDEPNGGNTPETGGELSDGGYITVGINLPKQAAGGMHARQRTNANDQFDHGTANEYAVNNAMLLIFTGTEAGGEKAAKFHSAYDLDMLSGGVNGPSNPDANITTTYLKTVHLNDIEDGDFLWGLVLVNYDENIVTQKTLFQPSQDGLKPDDKFKGLISKLSINSNELTKDNTTFETFCENITGNSFINDGYFFMTNAVISTADADAAAAGTVYTLQKIGLARDVAKPTEAEAQAYPAASFYVERAVAKATLVAESANTTGDLAANNITIKSVQWVLDNTEPTSYLVRNVGDNSYIAYQQAGLPKRFVGTVKIGTTALQPIADLYRHYWAIDPQYDKAATLTTAVSAGMENSAIAADLFKAAGSANPQYCHENTFNVAEMTHQNTTRALLKVTFNLPEGNDGYLYTVNDLQSADNIFSTQADATSLPVQAIIESHYVRDAIKAALKPGQSITINKDNVDTYLDIDFQVNPKSNLVYVNSVSFKDNDAYTATPAAFDLNSDLVKNVNASFQVVRYDGGVAYYEIRFKHFGDEYTPWLKANNTSSMQSTAEAYDGNENDYLGRWGMVRNNWYEINLNSIKRLGMPVIGQLDVTSDDTPDDDKIVEKWLSFKINILSWAKRVQNEDI
ncbi:MAG: fimbria major subunit [Muribaculaceae bacterium]